MVKQKVVIWTPEHRREVIQFLKLYTDQLEKQINNKDEGYGLPQIQSGVLHIVDMTLPPKIEYVVNSGPSQQLLEGTKVILTSKEYQEYEDILSKE
ncbi:hypothetical protein AUK57_00725 [Candidatus Saccharibacteria bacterium CG2_30_41_52]|nr:MAG: hypothetical protein AUK57_00725 [Candidatus Saccharibacteria bacterium CG2_30_41_52]